MKDNQAKYPQLRFKGFTDPWEQRKLGELGKIYTGNTPKTSDLDNWTDNKEGHIWITPTDIDKLIMSDSDRHLSEQGWSKARKIPENSVLITSIASIGKNAINAVPVAFNQQINAIVPEKNDSYFILSAMIKDTARFASVAGQTATAIINKTTFEKFQIATPSYEEQQKIGSFFKQLDNTITIHQRKLAKLKELKQGYLQKLFPKNGAKVPELRFAGFADDWEQRNLGEWSDVRDGTHASPKYIEQGHPMVTSKNLTDSGLDMSDVSYLTDEDFNEINQRSKVDIGDILFGMIGTIGKPVIVDRDDFAIKNVALIKEKTSPEIINTWLIQYLKSPSFERFIQKENAGGTQKFIALGLIRDMKLMAPSVQEQARIGELLNHLDNLIAANQRKLDLLKEQKKGFLQKMFV